MVPRAAVLTPNLPEAEALSGISIADRDDMERVGAALLALGADTVLLKGGHLEGEVVTDLLFAEGGTQAFEGPRIATTSTHGTGCTLASAVAAGLAQGIGMGQAVARARDYVRRAIETAPGLGRGHGPLNHAHAVTPYFLKD
jgi:hydroxymethylpyrimidine/phosphomethylpyrimidine kinase